MPRYFFDVKDSLSAPKGQLDLVDIEGAELKDIYTAQAEAIRLSGEMLREIQSPGWNGGVWELAVSDADRRLLLVLRFTAEEHNAPFVVDLD